MQLLGGDTAVQLSQVALYAAPESFDLVGAGELAAAMVPGLVVVAQQRQLLVGIPFVADHQAALFDTVLDELLQGALTPAVRDTQGNAPGVRLDSTGDNTLWLWVLRCFPK